jgi:hypothetical protein
VKREPVERAGTVAASALSQELSEPSNRNQRASSSSGSLMVTQQQEQQQQPDDYSSSAWLKLEDSEMKVNEAAAALSPVSAQASFALSPTLSPFFSAVVRSPTPLAASDEAAAAATPAASAASTFIPRVLPKRRAADLWPPSPNTSKQ